MKGPVLREDLDAPTASEWFVILRLQSFHFNRRDRKPRPRSGQSRTLTRYRM